MPTDHQPLRRSLSERLPSTIIKAVRAHRRGGGAVRLTCCEPGQSCKYYLCMLEFLPGDRAVLFDDPSGYYRTTWGKRAGDKFYIGDYIPRPQPLTPKRPEYLRYALGALAGVEIKRSTATLRRIELAFEKEPTSERRSA